MNTDNFEEILESGINDIERAKKQKRILRFNARNGVVSDVESEKSYVPGQGIVEGVRETEIILDCGHPASFGLGHIAECGHAICLHCAQNEGLVCAEKGCFRKLCTVKGCRNRPCIMIGLSFCRKHQIGMLIEVLSSKMFEGGRKTQHWIDDMQQEYRSRRLPEKRKELPYGKQNFPRQSS